MLQYLPITGAPPMRHSWRSPRLRSYHVLPASFPQVVTGRYYVETRCESKQI
jgi:hypothetical protein